jgi:hypothetical protein
LFYLDNSYLDNSALVLKIAQERYKRRAALTEERQFYRIDTSRGKRTPEERQLQKELNPPKADNQKEKERDPLTTTSHIYPDIPLLIPFYRFQLIHPPAYL